MNTINFNQVATNEKIPGYYGEITTTNANQGVFDYPTRILVVGQKLGTGTAPALSPQIIVDDLQAKELFGLGSSLALMCAAILRVQNTIEIHAIAQDDLGASATAAGTIAVDTPATVSGTLYLYVAGERLAVGINASDTKAQIATAIVSAINEEVDLPVTAAVDGADDELVNVTAKNAGLVGNEIKITTNFFAGEFLPASLALTITNLSGGTANPDVGDVIDAIEGEWFTDIAMQYTDAANLTLIETELKDRFSATGKMDAQCAIAVRGTFSENYTFCNGRNSVFVSPLAIPADALEPAWIWGAQLCGWIAYWSNQHPARPYKGLVLKGLKAPKTKYTTTERRILLGNGGSTFTVNANGEVTLERVVTMYQENAGGIKDETYLDVTTVKTFSHIRYDDSAYITTLYFAEDGKVLTDNEAAAAKSDILVTPKTIDASSFARAQLWIEQGWVSEVVEIRSEIDANDPTRVNRLMSLDITNPLMILATKLDMRV